MINVFLIKYNLKYELRNGKNDHAPSILKKKVDLINELQDNSQQKLQNNNIVTIKLYGIFIIFLLSITFYYYYYYY